MSSFLSEFSALRPVLLAMARRLNADSDAAEDLVQETCLRVIQRRDPTAIGNMRGYILRVARNLLTDTQRQRRVQQAVETELRHLRQDPETGISAEQILASREALRAVMTVLDGLPPRTREIFLMNRIQRKSHVTIARELGLTEETIYYHIKRAVSQLSALRGDLR